jgi:LPXTG-motif cell wall-anchored protein
MPSKTLRALSLLALTGFAFVSSSAAATAVTETNGIRLYLSAPFVQGPSFTGVDVALETFDSANLGAGGCLGASAVGEITTTCMTVDGDSSGGASVSSDTPTIGGSASRYATTPWPSGGDEIEIIFPEGKRFIGLWWSAGNVESGGGTTNFIEFYRGDDLLVTMTANQIMDLLGGSVPNPYPGTATLDTEGGGSQTVGYYYGHPATHSSLTPTSKSTWTGDNPFVYLNLFTAGATTVDRVIIGGDGFEFDNFATSNLDKSPTNDMVFVVEYLDTVTPPEEENSGGGTGGEESQSGALASTGFDATMLSAVGGLAIMAGTAILFRRRRA